jgi:ankyrin repeat protein
MAGRPSEALLTSISRGDRVTIEEIVTLEIDFNSNSENTDRTLLTAAAYGDQPDLIRALVTHGADLEQPTFWGKRALHVAAAADSPNSIETLIGLGAEIDSEANCGTTPLMVAAACGNRRAIKVLLDHGADIHRLDFIGCNAWLLATEKEHGEVARDLALAGACTDL